MVLNQLTVHSHNDVIKGKNKRWRQRSWNRDVFLCFLVHLPPLLLSEVAVNQTHAGVPQSSNQLVPSYMCFYPFPESLLSVLITVSFSLWHLIRLWGGITTITTIRRFRVVTIGSMAALHHLLRWVLLGRCRLGTSGRQWDGAVVTRRRSGGSQRGVNGGNGRRCTGIRRRWRRFRLWIIEVEKYVRERPLQQFVGL